MEIIDYYAALGVPRNATEWEILKRYHQLVKENGHTTETYLLADDACNILTNRYKRARYDRNLGYLLVIQVERHAYPNAVIYQTTSKKPFYQLQDITEKFKAWVYKRFELTWEEALLANFLYSVKSHDNDPYLVLQFPRQFDLENFVQLLLQEKMIQAPEAA